MKYKQLGNTGIFASTLSLGSMTFGKSSWPGADVLGGLGSKDVDTLVGRSFDAGINLFDSANVYAAGNSEELLGQALQDKRKDVLIATKFLGRMGAGPNQVGGSRNHILQEVESSLKRLRTDYIDLYQMHDFDPMTPLEETLRTLTDLVRSGKVRYIGCSNFAAWQLMKALGISAREHLEKFVTTQSYYSLVGRDLENEIVPMIRDQKMGLLVWGPLAGGVLTGKYKRDPKALDGEKSRRNIINFPPIDIEKSFDVVDVIKRVAARHGNTTASQVALAWLLHQDHVTSVIIGAKSESQLMDNLGSVGLNLNADDLDELNSVSQPQVTYPRWMEQMHADRRPGEKLEMGDVWKPTF